MQQTIPSRRPATRQQLQNQAVVAKAGGNVRASQKQAANEPTVQDYYKFMDGLPVNCVTKALLEHLETEIRKAAATEEEELDAIDVVRDKRFIQILRNEIKNNGIEKTLNALANPTESAFATLFPQPEVSEEPLTLNPDDIF